MEARLQDSTPDESDFESYEASDLKQLDEKPRPNKAIQFYSKDNKSIGQKKLPKYDPKPSLKKLKAL